MSYVRSTLSIPIRDFHHRLLVEGCARDDAGRRLTPYSEDALYEVLFRVFFGIVPGSADHQAFREIYRILDVSHRRRATVWSPSEQSVKATLRTTTERLEQQISRFGARATDPPGSYLEAAWRHGGREAVDEVVLLNLIYLLQVTCTDLVGLFDWILKKLSDHPEWQDRLHAAIREHGFDSEVATDLAERIVTGTFRLEQSEHIYRKIATARRSRMKIWSAARGIGNRATRSGAGRVRLHTATPPIASKPRAAMAAGAGRCHTGSVGVILGSDGTLAVVSNAPSIASRTSPTSRMRWSGSFSRQRRRTVRSVSG